MMQRPLTCVEICAGAGGQALCLAMAGVVHVALVEYEADYCEVLRKNRPEWNVICAGVHDFDGRPYRGVDLLAGDVPCSPFSVAGKQLGQDDDRDLFPEAIFIHGCYWHGHDCGSLYAHSSQLNRVYWGAKNQRTQQRDQEYIAKLEADGWKVIVLWECQIRLDFECTLSRLNNVIIGERE